MAKAQHDIDVAINAAANDFFKTMKEIRGDTDKTAKQSGSAFAQMSSRLDGVKTSAKAMAAGITIAAGVVVGFAKSAKDASQSIVDLSSQARRSGVDFEAFQELGFAAQKNRVSLDLLSDGLYEMTLRAAEFANTGAGPGEDAFKRLGLSAEQVAEMLKQPDKMFQQVLSLIRQLDDASQKFVLDEIFAGSAAESFVNLLETSNVEIDGLRQSARDLGAVMDEDILKRAEDINERWNRMSTIISTNVKGSIVNLASDILTIVDAFNNMMETANSTTVNLPSYGDAKTELANLKAEHTTAFNNLIDAQVDGDATKIERYQSVYENLTRELTRAKSLVDHLDPQNHKGSNDFGFSLPAKPIVPIVDDEKKTKAKKKERDLVLEVTKALQQEFEMLGKTELERKMMVALRRANVDTLSEEGQQISQLVEQIYHEEQALEAVKEASEKTAEAQESLFDYANGLIDKAIDGTLDWSDALSIVTKELTALLKGQNSIFDLFTGGQSSGGFLSNIFGGLFGGGGYPVTGQVGLFANGGITQNGQSLPTFANGGVSTSAAIFGEGTHAEAAVPLPGDRKIPVNMKIKGGSASSAGMVVNIINNSGSKVEQRERQNSGGKTLDVIIDDAVAGQVSKVGSKSRSAIESQFGLAGGLARR
ncbi:MAG: hypothetical protein ABJO86_00645 [Lentilitoribacter sp.]